MIRLSAPASTSIHSPAFPAFSSILNPCIHSAVAAHTNRQYMFKLNSLFTIDGTTTGNESKYINHASGDNANVRAYGINSHFTHWVFTKKKLI